MSQDAIAFLGESRAFRAARERLRRITRTDATVLIEGETGTGKELAARVLHYEGSRSGGPFIPINCGAIPDALLESELFGFRQGAFTDAKSSAPGILLLAHGGTLFLDEVDSLSTRAQVALLRFLQDRVIRPLGSGAERTANVRIVAATNQDLKGLVEQRLFRHDLYYRLNVMHVVLPPLRERDADVEIFAAHLLRQFAARYGTPVPQLDERSRIWLRSHSWPGNVRELENLIESEFLLAEGESPLRLSCLSPHRAPTDAYPVGAVNDAQVDRAKEPSWNYRRAKAELLEEFDRTFLNKLMRFAGGNVALAARTSGKERRELGRLLRKYGMIAAAFRGASRDLR